MSGKPNHEDIRMLMDQAWKDHHHTRNQTWRALQMVAALGVGLIGIDARYSNAYATTAAAVLLSIVAIIGIAITIRHAKVERAKMKTILNCEEKLGIFELELIEKTGLAVIPTAPQSVNELAKSLFYPSSWSVNSFIAKMHACIILFALIFIIFRWISVFSA